MKEDQILDLFITNLDDGSLKSISESFRDICDKDDSKLDVFFYHTILSCIKKYKNLEDTPKLYNKWCLNICEAKKIDFEKRSEYRTYYDKLSPSMFDKRINYYRAFDNHYEIVKKNIYESLYENPKWTFETLYCPVNVTLKGDKDDAVTVNDDEAFNIWNNSCDEGLLIIQGEPGSGKSTITKKITQKLLIDGSLVFYIQLYNLDLTHKTINEDLTYLLKNEYPLFKMMISNHINEEFQEIEELKKAIFIFDGFDEIAGIDEEKKYEHFIREINKIGKMTKVILVGRRYMFDFIMYSSLTCKYYTLSIDNLFEDNAEKILKHYSHLFKSPQMLDIKDLKGIDKEFISNPLLIFLYVYVQSKNRNDDFCKIKNKANLYDLIIRTTYKRDYKIKPCISSIQIKENEINSLSNYTLTLEIIGFVGYINNLREVDVAVCKELAHSIGLVSFDYWLDTTNNQKPYRLLMHFFLKNKKSRLYFFHKTFNEYLGQRFIIDFFINYDKLNDSFRNEIRKLLIKKHNIFNDSDSFFKDIVYSLNRSDYLDLKNNLTELFIEAFNIINKNYFGFDYDKFIFVLNFLSSIMVS